MGKKKGEQTGPYRERRKPIRLFLPEEEYREVRIAAAMALLPMSEFCRQAALEKARALQNETRRRGKGDA